MKLEMTSAGGQRKMFRNICAFSTIVQSYVIFVKRFVKARLVRDTPAEVTKWRDRIRRTCEIGVNNYIY